jgi:hypothetical protein
MHNSGTFLRFDKASPSAIMEWILVFARNKSARLALPSTQKPRSVSDIFHQPRGSKTDGLAALLLLELLIDHLSVVGKRGLIFRILSEVGVFLHVYLPDGILFLHAAPIERTNLNEEIT